MKSYLIAYVATAAFFLLVDLVWLGVVAKSFYAGQLGGLLRDKPDLVVALLFYALYVVGVVIFAVSPGLSSGRWQTALMYGALFGFFAYATYDLTNLATLRDWPVALSLVDLAWGTALTACSAAFGTVVARAVSG